MAVTIRQAEMRDIPALAELSAFSTEKITDCLPEFAVAAAGDVVIGTVRLARIGDDEWWLDGPFVQVDFGSAGRLLSQHAVRLAESAGRGLLRLCAAAGDWSLRELAAEARFSQLGRYLLYQADSIANERVAEQFWKVEEPASIRAFLDSSPFFEHARLSIEESHTWYLLNDERLSARIASSCVYGWHNPTSPDGVIIIDASSQNQTEALNIAYLDAAVGSLAVMAQAVRSHGAALGYRSVRHRFLARPERLVAIEQAGWRRPPDGDEDYLFSRPLNVERYIDP